VLHSDLEGLSEALVLECLEILHGHARPTRTAEQTKWLMELSNPPSQGYPLHRSSEDVAAENSFDLYEVGLEFPL
jgi:hypothetical protein